MGDWPDAIEVLRLVCLKQEFTSNHFANILNIFRFEEPNSSVREYLSHAVFNEMSLYPHIYGKRQVILINVFVAQGTPFHTVQHRKIVVQQRVV